MKDSIHVCGFIEKDLDGLVFDFCSESIASIIAGKISEIMTEETKPSLQDNSAGKGNQIEVSMHTPLVFMKMYFSNKKCSIEEAESNLIFASIGELDILQEWYGYSEFTIMGYDVESFSLVSINGKHDIQNILESNLHKYVHIVIEPAFWKINPKI